MEGQDWRAQTATLPGFVDNELSGFVAPAGADREARPRFVPLDPPTHEEVTRVLHKIITRVRKLVERRGRSEVDEEPVIRSRPPTPLPRDRLAEAPSPSTRSRPRCAPVSRASRNLAHPRQTARASCAATCAATITLTAVAAAIAATRARRSAAVA